MAKISKKHILLALASAILLLCGLQPIGIAWLGAIGFIPLYLIYLDKTCRAKSLATYTLAVGAIYYAFLLYCLIYFSWKIYVVVVLLFAPTFLIYFIILRLITSRLKGDFSKVIVAFSIWLLMLKLYGLTPFGSTLLEIPFYGPLPLMQLICVTGISGLTAIIMILNISCAMVFQERTISRSALLVSIILFLAGAYAWGAYNSNINSTGRPVKLALIQHNLPMSGLWRLEHKNEILSEYERLARKAAKDKPDLIVFPLYSLPEDPLRNPGFFGNLAREVSTHILLGTHISEVAGGNVFDDGYFNAALLFSPNGKLIDHYRAVVTPPFRDNNETTEKEYKVMNSPFGKLGILLCYEDTVPRLAREAVSKGAELLIALSNPGHFMATHLPYYHLREDRFRAIESGRYVVRTSANGYSALINPDGRLLMNSKLNQEEILWVTPKLGAGQTIFHRYPNILSWASLIFLVGLLFASLRSQRSP